MYKDQYVSSRCSRNIPLFFEKFLKERGYSSSRVSETGTKRSKMNTAVRLALLSFILECPDYLGKDQLDYLNRA